jgi:transcriptional regulator with GAF, ATPase, and Fis domain
VFTIFIPPPRERKADAAAGGSLPGEVRLEHKRTIKRISTPAIDMLASYHWSGNVREPRIRSARRADVRREVVYGHHLPPSLQTAECRHGHARVPDDAVTVREGPVAGRAQDDAWKPGEGGAAARHDRAHHQLQGRRYGIDAKRFRS